MTITIDYSLDANNFFDTQAKRDLMQLAASALGTMLGDSLTAITPSGVDTWSESFANPSTGAIQSITNPSVPGNTMVVYVGGGRLAGSAEAGEGSTGGFSASGDANWLNTVKARGQAGALLATPTDYGPWGGSIEFDNSGNTNWYFGTSLASLGSSQTDFLSVAEHELGHVLGLGTTQVWQSLSSGGFFQGVNAKASFGGPVPLDPGGGHWADGTKSGGGPAVMDPVLLDGTRVLFTPLDLAGLKDLGWQVQAATPQLQFSASSYAGVDGGSVVVTVTRSGGLGAVSVHYATSDGTAKAGLDYAASAGTLNFGLGEASKTFSVSLLNDGLLDGTESFNLTLSSPNGGALGSQSIAVASIADNAYHAVGDFDGDGRTDVGVFRPSTAQWFISGSTAGPITPAPAFGATNLFDIPVVGDFDGVGHAEEAIFRPSTSQWFVMGPSGGHLLGTFGATNLFDIPVPGDYDGVGHTEMAVFRPSTSQWFVMGPTGGRLLGTFGATNLFDIPVPGDYDGVGHAEMAVFRPSTSQWFVLGPTGGRLLGTFGATNLFDIPVPGDYDGVGHAEMAVYRPSSRQWFVLGPGGGHVIGGVNGTASSDLPVLASVGSLVKRGVTGQSIPHGLAAARFAAPTVDKASNLSPGSARLFGQVLSSKTGKFISI